MQIKNSIDKDSSKYNVFEIAKKNNNSTKINLAKFWSAHMHCIYTHIYQHSIFIFFDSETKFVNF